MSRWANTQNLEVFGQVREDVDKFTTAVLKDGDIAILDQHLEYGGDNNILGTDIIEHLLRKGYKGLICVRSGNVAVTDLANYEEAGAHCAFGKDVSMRQMIEEIKVAYTRYIMKRLPHPGLVPSSCADHSFSSIPSVAL